MEMRSLRERFKVLLSSSIFEAFLAVVELFRLVRGGLLVQSLPKEAIFVRVFLEDRQHAFDWRLFGGEGLLACLEIGLEERGCWELGVLEVRRRVVESGRASVRGFLDCGLGGLARKRVGLV